jgi:hypothetical protein
MAYPFDGFSPFLEYGYPKDTPPSLFRQSTTSDYISRQMELFSEAFRAAVLDAVSSPKIVLGTVMSKAHPWVDRLKKMPQVQVVVVTLANRDGLVQHILPMLTN